MNEFEILKAAASIRGKRSWRKKLKKLGGKRAASAHMKAVRSGKKLSPEAAISP